MLHPKTLESHINWLRDMVAKIERYTQNMKSYEDFIADERNIDMVIPPIVQIGEIAGKMQKLYPDYLELPYSKIVGLRNILVHMYHRIEPETLRHTITVNIPELKQLLDEHDKK